MNNVRGLLAASVISIQNSCFVYPACQKCFSRLILDSRRCIQDFNQLSGETNTDASPRVLVQAVETCFIGKRFIFGVKRSASEDGGGSAASSILQNSSRITRSTKSLTACQIFLPNAAVTGFTVISCFHQLQQSAKLRSCGNGSYLPAVSSALIDEAEAVSELSSLSTLSRNSCFVQSGGRESSLGSWQQSLSLTSSVAWITEEDFPALEVGKLVSEQHEEGRPGSAEPCSVSLNNQTLWDSEFCSSSLTEGDKEEDNESSSQLSHTDNNPGTDKLERVSSSKTEHSHGNSSRLLQHPLEFGVESIYPETNRNHSYPETSLFYEGDASASGGSRVDSMLWDELPFSESLNEFLARLEDAKSVVSSPSLGTGKPALLEGSKLGVKLHNSYPRQTPVAGALPESSILRSFLPPAEKGSWEDVVFACPQLNANPQSDEVSRGESSSSVLSLTKKEHGASWFIPSPHLPTVSQSLPAPSEPSVSMSRDTQSREANTDPSKSAWSFISLQGTAECRETSCLKRSEAAACVHAAQDSCSAGSENKENSSTPSQRTDLTFTGARDSAPATPNTSRRIYKGELKPLTELQGNTFRNVSRRETLWNKSFPEGSYNASADLFDPSARAVEKHTEFIGKSCNSLTEEDILAEMLTAPELVFYPGGIPCNTSKLSWSLHRSPLAFREHSTPAAYSFCESECSSVSAQDFVPYSQSTPMIKPSQKPWPVGERNSCITIFTPKNPTKIHSKGKRSRSAFQNTLLQQLTGRLVKRERPSPREDKERNRSVSPHSQLPADLEEWIPPSGNKRLKPAVSLNLKAISRAAGLESSCGRAGRNPIPESRGISGKDLHSRNERFNPGSTARIPTTPVPAGVTKALFLNDTDLETCSPLEGKSLFSSPSYSGDILEGAAGWSPELFFQAWSPLSNKPKY
ncbi:DNA damage-induced apoptosis suppressor protein isoform 2-T2 [Porphyrio hochstetteri]